MQVSLTLSHNGTKVTHTERTQGTYVSVGLSNWDMQKVWDSGCVGFSFGEKWRNRQLISGYWYLLQADEVTHRKLQIQQKNVWKVGVDAQTSSGIAWQSHPSMHRTRHKSQHEWINRVVPDSWAPVGFEEIRLQDMFSWSWVKREVDNFTIALPLTDKIDAWPGSDSDDPFLFEEVSQRTGAINVGTHHRANG